jgi:hypothetical protein
LKKKIGANKFLEREKKSWEKTRRRVEWMCAKTGARWSDGSDWRGQQCGQGSGQTAAVTPFEASTTTTTPGMYLFVCTP